MNGTASFEEYAIFCHNNYQLLTFWWPTVNEVKPIHGTKPTKPCNYTSHVITLLAVYAGSNPKTYPNLP